MVISISDRLIHLNAIVHRIDTMLYLSIHMKHEKIILVNDQEIANVVEKNHMHVKDNLTNVNDDQVMTNDYYYDDGDDKNLMNNHND